MAGKPNILIIWGDDIGWFKRIGGSGFGISLVLLIQGHGALKSVSDR
jgi:hypothetical protein